MTNDEDKGYVELDPMVLSSELMALVGEDLVRRGINPAELGVCLVLFDPAGNGLNIYQASVSPAVLAERLNDTLEHLRENL